MLVGGLAGNVLCGLAQHIALHLIPAPAIIILKKNNTKETPQ